MPSLAIAVALLSVATATPSSAPTAADLAAKNAEAKGGLARLRGLTSVRMTGKLLVNNGQTELAIVQSVRRPGAVRVDATLQGMTATQAYDGEQGWQINPFGGRKDPERMPPDDAKSLVETAEIEGPLVDWETKGSALEYLGTEDVDGTDAHKIKVTKKNGDVQYVFLDPDHFLEIRVHSQRLIRGVQEDTVTDLGEYEKVEGIFWPLAVESGPKGSRDRQKIEFTEVQVGVPLDDASFRFPAAATHK